MSKPTAYRCRNRHWLCLLAAVVTFVALHLPVSAGPVDSLYHIYINADNRYRVDAVNAISKELNAEGITDTLYQCDKSTTADMMDAIAHYLMAEYTFDQGQYEKALEYGLMARNTVMAHSKPDKFKSDVLGLVSNAQFRLGDYDEALKTLLVAYKVDSDLGDSKLISSDLNSLAAIYLAVEQPEPGIAFIEKAINLERQLQRPDRLAIRLGIASELYLVNGEPEKAMKAIDEAYQIDHQAGRHEKAAVRLVQKGAVLERLSRLDEAKSVIQSALPVLEDCNALYSIAVAHNQLGSIAKKQGDMESAASYYKKALEYSIKCGTPKIESTAERGLWETLRESNPALALLHLERYTTLSDSINKELISAQIKVKDATNQNLEQTEIAQKSHQFSQLMLWGGIVIGILMLAMLAALFYSWRKGKVALKMAQQTEELRSHFFSNITNELQTPLTIVLNAGKLLLEGGKNTADENKRLGSMIVNHGQNMLGLVNDLIDIEQTQSSIEPPEFRQGDIVMFVRMLVENYSDYAHQQMVNLEFTSPMNSHTVHFPHDHIRRITHRLIANALKYTDSHGSITVKLEAPEANKMRLIVADTGKSIPAEEYSRLFEPFYQSANGDKGVETVLQLSLVNQLVKSMNGTIAVESEKDTGTSFTIDFPVRPVEGGELAENENKSHFAERRLRQSDVTKQKPLVFIVENNEDVGFFIAKILKEDFNLRFARDGREALSNAQDLVPDLIVTNITMPVMGGKELIKRIRENTALNHIPIIALTASTTFQERLSCIEAGADAVLVKPFYSDELRTLARHFINQRSILREQFTSTGSSLAADNNVQRSKDDQEFINKLIDVIHAQMAKEDIDMEHIAAALQLSRKQLRTRVMAITDLTPVAFVLQVRLNYARRLISTQDISLTTIASKCGFQNLSHFSKAFKQQFGVSPLQFRKTNSEFNTPKS